jgi:MFS family permease
VTFPIESGAAAADRGKARAAPDSARDPVQDPSMVRSIIAGIMLAMFLSALEQTIVAPALPTIGASLGGFDELSWVAGAYLLGATAATPLFGKLSDIYGRRRILLAGVSIFIAGSAACALAPTMGALIAARALQGIGGGSILPISQAIVADLVSPRERARYQAQSAVIFMTASVAGPLVGGVLTDHLHWSLIFWINLPLGALALVMSDRALTRLPRNDRPHRLDWPGAGLMVGAALALMLAMTWGGVRYAWTSWPIAALVGGSAALWLLFAWRIATAAEPFVPLMVLRDRTAAGTVAAAFFAIGTIIGLSFFMPLYLELSLQTTALLSGAALIAFMGGITLGAMTAGTALARYRHYKRIPVAGLLVAIAALAGLAADRQPSFAAVAALLLFAGAGIGPMYPVTTVLIQNAVPRHQIGVATGTLNFFRLLGGTIVVAGFGAIVLGGGIGAPASPLSHGSLPHPGSAAAIFAWVFAAAAGCLAAALTALLIVEEHPLRGPDGARAEP